MNTLNMNTLNEYEYEYFKKNYEIDFCSMTNTVCHRIRNLHRNILILILKTLGQFRMYVCMFSKMQNCDKIMSRADCLSLISFKDHNIKLMVTLLCC